MSLTLADLLASPDHYLHSLDGEDAIFVPMDRAAYARSIFLDGRISPAAEGSMRIPIAMLRNGSPQVRPTAWIMHVAHCGSTLLARALDEIGDTLVLREPQALRQVALQPTTENLATVAALLSKRYRSDRPTLIKANVPVNFILPQLAALDRSAKMIFLHMTLRDYLLAILRSDDHRAWLQRVTTQLAPHLESARDATDGERAAALWLAQIELYAATAVATQNARSVDAERFFTRPREVLSAVATHLRVGHDARAIGAVVEGPLFATYSKNPGVAFDNAARLARRAAIEQGLQADLDTAERWIDARGGRAAEATAALASFALEIG